MTAAGDRPCCRNASHTVLSTGERQARHEWRNAVAAVAGDVVLAVAVAGAAGVGVWAAVMWR